MTAVSRDGAGSIACLHLAVMERKKERARQREKEKAREKERERNSFDSAIILAAANRRNQVPDAETD